MITTVKPLGTSILERIGNTPLVRDVMVGGEWVVRGFTHRDEDRIAARYRTVLEKLSPR